METVTLLRQTLQRIENALDVVLGGYGNLVHSNDKAKLLSVRQEVNAALSQPEKGVSSHGGIEPFSGCVDRIGAFQESSGDTAHTCYALLLQDHAAPLILKTNQGTHKHDEVIGIRTRIALTIPGDSVTFEFKCGNVIEFQNESLARRLGPN